jgi:hypothetical protein
VLAPPDAVVDAPPLVAEVPAEAVVAVEAAVVAPPAAVVLLVVAFLLLPHAAATRARPTTTAPVILSRDGFNVDPPRFR